MPSEIKFNSFGLPYLVEFANMSLRSKKGDKAAKATKASKASSKEKEKVKAGPPKPPPKNPMHPTRCPTCGHSPPNLAPLRRENSTTQSKPPRPGGLYIRFASSPGTATARISSRRLARLRSAIEDAVTEAGMMKPSPDETGSTADMALDTVDTMRSRDTARTDTSKKALFKGTYGQVKQALKEAGLVATPCSENGFEHGE